MGGKLTLSWPLLHLGLSIPFAPPNLECVFTAVRGVAVYDRRDLFAVFRCAKKRILSRKNHARSLPQRLTRAGAK